MLRHIQCFFPLVDALRSFQVSRGGAHMCPPPGRAKVAQTPGRARVKPAVHLHTPNRLIAEFNMGAYEYALTRRVSVAIATHVKFSD